MTIWMWVFLFWLTCTVFRFWLQWRVMRTYWRAGESKQFIVGVLKYPGITVISDTYSRSEIVCLVRERLGPILQKLACQFDVPDPLIVLMVGDTRVGALLEWFHGRPVIKLSADRCARLTDEELEGVIAHELAHYELRFHFLTLFAYFFLRRCLGIIVVPWRPLKLEILADRLAARRAGSRPITALLKKLLHDAMLRSMGDPAYSDTRIAAARYKELQMRLQRLGEP